MAAQEKHPGQVLDDFKAKLRKSDLTKEKKNETNHQPSANNKQSSSIVNVSAGHKHKENKGGEVKLPEHNKLSSKGRYPNRRPFIRSGKRTPSDNGGSVSVVRGNGQREQSDNVESNALCSSNVQPQNTDGKKFPPKKSKRYDKEIKPIDFKGLNGLLNKEPSFIITCLANPKSKFNDLTNNHPLTPDLLTMVIEVLSRIVESELRQLKIKVLTETMTPEMIDDINRYVQRICIEDDQNQLKSVESFFKNTLKVFEACVNCFPSIQNEKLKSVLKALNLSMINAKANQGISISDRLFDVLRDMTDQVSSFVENSQRIDQEKSKIATFNESKAPNNFRDMEIVPTIEDFMCQRAFLRKNIVQGSYRNCEEYLDVQFRLLREDFIDPLRTGIFEYLESVDTPSVRKKISNVRIYPKVQFFGISRDRLGFRINFDVERKIPKNINWEFNKRFKVGSLLLLTQNDFKQFFLATIVDRNIQQLYRSTLTIAFVPGTERPKEVFGPDVFFLMAESEVYYEAYRPVLSALQQMTEHTFPMKKYIVDVITDSIPPHHLRTNSRYIIEDHEFDVLDESSWPTPDQLKLNPSQHKAFKTALTSEFAVVQGPPGTGKTFLALKITEVLLKNGVSGRTPIVVICYTNHALDQFLEGILKHTDNLIRIGSQSKNEALEKYSISVVRKGKKEKRELHLSDLYRSKVSDKRALRESLDYIKALVAQISNPNGILDLNILKPFISPFQYDDLKDQIVDWLFFEDDPNWFYEVAQTVNDTYGSTDMSLNPDTPETDVPNDEPDEEEEEEENTRRLADLREDGFLFDKDTKAESNKPVVTYSFRLREAVEVLNQLTGKLIQCQRDQRDGFQRRDLFYYEQNLKENIQRIQWKINHFNHEAFRFQQFQFDGKRLQSLAVLSVWDIEPPLRWQYYWSWVHLYCCQLNQKIHLVTNR